MTLRFATTVMTVLAIAVAGAATVRGQNLHPVLQRVEDLDARVKRIEAVQKQQGRPAADPVADTVLARGVAELRGRVDAIGARVSRLADEMQADVTARSETRSLPVASPVEVAGPFPEQDSALLAALAVLDDRIQHLSERVRGLAAPVSPVGAAASNQRTTTANAAAVTAAPMGGSTGTVEVTQAAAGGAPRAAGTPDPARATPSATPSVSVSYRAGRGFTLESPDGMFSLQPGGRLQLRHTLTAYDGDRHGRNLSNFTVEHFELVMAGKAFARGTYKFAADFNRGTARLTDGYAEWSGPANLKAAAGQLKVSFDRQQKISWTSQTFVDRPLAARTYGISRDIGFIVSGTAASKRWQYNVGLFNGDGEGKSNLDAGHLWAARLSVNPLGDFGMIESNVDGCKSPLLFCDLALAQNVDNLTRDWDGDGKIGGDGDLSGTTRLVTGVGFRQRRVFTQGEYYFQQDNPKHAGLALVNSRGWYTQAGLMIIPATLEVALRVGATDPNLDVAHDGKTEGTVGINRFFGGLGHAAKFTLDATLRQEPNKTGGKYRDIEVRTQLQVSY